MMKNIMMRLWMLAMTMLALYSCSAEPEVSKIILDQEQIVLVPGQEAELIVSVEPSGYSGKVEWESTDGEVVSVEQSGKITAVSPGRAFVLAKAGGLTQGCAVTVKSVVTSIEFSSGCLLLDENFGGQLKYVTVPEKLVATKLIWESSDKNVLIVSEGFVQVVGLGRATITVWAEDNPQVRASIEVEVAKLITSITLSQSTAIMYENKTLQLSATVTPVDSAYPQLKWYSTDNSVVTVDQNGLVTSKKQGQAKIVVEAVSGSAKAECNITVSGPLPNPETDESVEDLKPGIGFDGWSDMTENEQ